ncbi:unnamed protein product [Mesocestoides corti]|uniref:Ribosomal RNA-processing protein 40 n=1 Tax=Mesocestoides corti TaxID=53468 RepID=A0A0R3UIV5_MESCO|nr:unnamed protein product [Mesocestoides corti]
MDEAKPLRIASSKGPGSLMRRGVAEDLFRHIGQIVSPGLVISASVDGMSAAWSLGSGVIQIPLALEESVNVIYILVRKFGILCYASPHDAKNHASATSLSSPNTPSPIHRLWVDSLPLMVSPSPVLGGAPQALHASQFSVGDRVLGVVKKKSGDLYQLDIGCYSSASLNYLSFEGASKKNRPDIRIRDVIYAAISQADPDLEIELTCMDETGKANGMGILGRYEPGSVGNAGGVTGGVMLSCSLELVRRLNETSDFPLLEKLSQKFPFEICVGCNGRIWITGRSPRETMLLVNAIALADYVAAEVCLRFVEELS